MPNGAQSDWEGCDPNSIEAAVYNAWENAKKSNSPPGKNRKKYKLDIYIDADNPIHSYVVVINP